MHLQSVQATVKMANAPELSLRGGRRPTWRPEREARGSALGVQSRGGTCSPHRPPIKTHQPIASVAALIERHAGWQYLRYAFCGVKLSSLSFRGAKRRGNLAESGPITGEPAAKTELPSRDCTPRALPRASRSGRHVGLWPPRNDNSGSFAILTAACTRRKCGAGSGMTLPYNGVCGRRECTEICRCATRRRGRRPLQRTAGSLGKFSIFRLPRAFLSCQIQIRYKNRTGSFG